MPILTKSAKHPAELQQKIAMVPKVLMSLCIIMLHANSKTEYTRILYS